MFECMIDKLFKKVEDLDKKLPKGIGSLELYFEFIETVKRYVLYGASSGGLKTKRLIEDLGGEVVAFVDGDSKKWGTEVEKVKVYSPSNLKRLLKHEKAKLMISSSYYPEIIGFLKDVGLLPFVDWVISPVVLGIGNPKWSFKVVSVFVGFFNEDYVGRPFYERCLLNKDKIVKVMQMIEDIESIESFLSVLKFRALCFVGSQPLLANYQQYICPAFNWKEDIIVDGGAYTGDTIEFFINNISFAKIYAFEPDEINFEVLRHKFSSNKKVVPVNCALWSNCGELDFVSLLGSGSHIEKGLPESLGSKVKLKAVSLDSFFLNGNIDVPTFIKLDVEGAEREALLGAEKIIKNFKPKLAVCVYHLSDDLWAIPLLVKDLNPSYKFFFGHHSSCLFESVLYAL